MSTARLDSHFDTLSHEYPTSDESEDDSPKNDRSYSNRRVDSEAKAEKERHNQAAKIVDKFYEPMNTAKTMGKLGLPLKLIYRIVEFICDSYEPRGIRIVAVILQDLLHMALASPDFYAALPYAYDCLKSKPELPTPRYSLPVTRDWGGMIREPDSFDHEEIKSGLDELGIKFRESYYRSHAGKGATMQR